MDCRAVLSLRPTPGVGFRSLRVTGHPALSVPAGESDGLPVGLMFVGGTFEDGTVLRAGHAYERAVGWDF